MRNLPHGKIQLTNVLEFGAGRGEFINQMKKYHQLENRIVELDEVYY